MKLNKTLIKYLLLIALINTLSAQELCKGGRCRVNLDSLDDVKISKDIKRKSKTLKVTKDKEISEKPSIKLAIK